MMAHTYPVAHARRRPFLKLAGLLMATAIQIPVMAQAQTAPAPNQLPTGGQVVAGQASISQSGASMNIDQATDRAAINWNSFDIGSAAHVNFNQPGSNSVALNRVLNGNASQIFGHLTANGKVYLTNSAGVYFAPGSSVNVGGLAATTHSITDDDFMAGRDRFTRDGAEGSVINEGSLHAGLGGYIALLAPEVRNEGVIVAQKGTVAMAAGDAYVLQFDGQGGLADVTVTPASMKALVENRQAVEAPGGIVIMSAQAANSLQGGVVRNSGSIEASGLVDDGGVVRLVASDEVDLGGTVKADAAAGSNGKGGRITAVASLDNRDSVMKFSGSASARGGDAGGNTGSGTGGNTGGDGGFVETSGSHVDIDANAKVDTSAASGKTGEWLIDPYNYTISGGAASAIGAALATSNVTVTTASDNATYGSNGNNASAGDIVVSSGITAAGVNTLTLTADNSITVNGAIDVGALVLTGPGGITLGADLTTLTAMTLNGNVTLASDVTLTSGVSNTYTTYTTYTVPTGVTSLTATLVGGSGGRGGNDGGHQGGSAGGAGVLTASFAVTGGQTVYIAPGSGGAAGGDSVTNTGGGAGGTNNFNIGNGGTGGNAGNAGSSGGGGGGGAATVLALTGSPTTGSQMLLAGGGGGAGGSGNNDTCPSICGDQGSANYRTDNSMTGQTGYNSTNGIGSPSIIDGGGSGAGGGGLLGGISNLTVFNTNEWTGRGGNVGQSGAANGFATTSLSTSLTNLGNSGNGYAIISYGGGTVGINGTVNGAHALNIVARSSDVDITGAVGGNTALTSLNITGSQGISLRGGSVNTTGGQTYNGPLTLNANNNVFTTTSNGAVTFGGDIVKGSGVSSNLSVSTGSGNVSLNGKTGTSGTPVGAINIATTGTTALAGPVYATSLAKTGSGQTNVSGGLVQTTGGQSYAGTLDLGGNTTLGSTGTGDITIGGAVSNNTQSNLTINAAGGNVAIAGNLAVGTNARPTPIGDVAITASGTVTLGSSGTPVSADAKSLSITANASGVYADGTTSFACGTGASAAGICLTGPATFDVATASSFAGPLAGTGSLTKSGAGKLTLTGNNTYTGDTTVNAGVLEIGGTGRLGGGTYNGNINVTGQVRFNNTVAQTLNGTMSGTGFINSPGSGVTDITTLAHADHYNLIDAYVVPVSSTGGSSSVYGSAPAFTYQIATTAAGGTAFTDADPTGTPTITGAPTNASGIGGYTISYGGGVTINNERYIVNSGNDLSWTVTAKPLTLTASKVYDGGTVFAAGDFTVSGTVNGDTAPTLAGDANVASRNAGNYTVFASTTLAQGNANYTLTGATVSATITPRPLDISVTKTYDGTSLFNRGFNLSGMVAGDLAPAVTGTANTPGATAGQYTRFASNNLVSSDANYTLTGGQVAANISPQPPVVPAAPVVTPVIIPTTLPQNPPELTMPDYVSPVPGSTSQNAGQPVDTGLQSQSQNQGLSQNQGPTASADNAPAAQNGGDQGQASGNDSGSGNGNTASAGNSGSGNAAPVATTTTDSGIVVSLVREPSSTSDGAITVAVPRAVAERSDGFSFPLPEQIAARAGSSASFSISTADGKPMPSWLQFNPETKTFTATAVPAGGLPIHLVIKTGSAETTIVIAETQ